MMGTSDPRPKSQDLLLSPCRVGYWPEYSACVTSLYPHSKALSRGGRELEESDPRVSPLNHHATLVTGRQLKIFQKAADPEVLGKWSL